MKIGIIGLGFMGGCIARSLIKNDSIKSIIAYDSNKDSLELALKEKNITNIAYSLDDFKDCDFIFICIPVGYIYDIVTKLKEIVKEDCIITDIGSTKRNIVEEISKVNVRFVGGHPMVGSERSGYETSNDYLYQNAYYILCEKDNHDDVEKLKNIVLLLGAIPIIVDYKKHDYYVAAISHVPQLVAYSLVNMVKMQDDEMENMKTLAAGGFKDITRIASSAPDMWIHICKDNKNEIVPMLDKFIEQIEYVRKSVFEDKDLYSYFDSSKKYRDSFINYNKVNGIIRPSIDVLIVDETGSLLKVVQLLTDNNINIKDISIENIREKITGVLRITFESEEEKDKASRLLKDNDYEISN